MSRSNQSIVRPKNKQSKNLQRRNPSVLKKNSLNRVEKIKGG